MKQKLIITYQLCFFVLILSCSTRTSKQMSELKFNPTVGSIFHYSLKEDKVINHFIAGKNVKHGTFERSELRFGIVKKTKFGYDINCTIISHFLSNRGDEGDTDHTALGSGEDTNRVVPNIDGSRFTTTTTKSGMITSIQGYNSVKERIENELKSQVKDSSKRSTYTGLAYSEDFFTSLFNNCLHWLPEYGIKLGDHWSKEVELGFPALTKINVIYNLSKVVGGTAIIEAKSEKIDSPLLPNVRLQGSVKIDMKSGILLEAKTDISIVSEYQVSSGKTPFKVTLKKEIFLNNSEKIQSE